MTRRVPPGRSGRVILRERLAMSEHAGDLLHQKEEALRRERTRLQGHEKRTRSAWTLACAELDRLIARVRLLGGSSELREIAALPIKGATMTCTWQTQMGVEYPGDVSAEPGPTPTVTASAAFGPAIEAYQAALIAAAEHAAAGLALGRVEHETAETRRRRRAVTNRLVPRLRKQLRQIEIDLDESEREEATRTRLAVDRRGEPS